MHLYTRTTQEKHVLYRVPSVHTRRSHEPDREYISSDKNQPAGENEFSYFTKDQRTPDHSNYLVARSYIVSTMNCASRQSFTAKCARTYVLLYIFVAASSITKEIPFKPHLWNLKTKCYPKS